MGGRKKPLRTKYWLCRCPMCDKIHTMQLVWYGKQVCSDGSAYMPRKNCLACVIHCDNVDYQSPAHTPDRAYAGH